MGLASSRQFSQHAQVGPKSLPLTIFYESNMRSDYCIAPLESKHFFYTKDTHHYGSGSSKLNITPQSPHFSTRPRQTLQKLGKFTIRIMTSFFSTVFQTTEQFSRKLRLLSQSPNLPYCSPYRRFTSPLSL